MESSAIPGVGLMRPNFHRSGLPSVRRVLQVLFYHHRKARKTVQESSAIVTRELIELHESKNLNTQRSWFIKKKICGLYESWRKFQINMKKRGKCYDKMRSRWDNQLNEIFVISKRNGQPLVKLSDSDDEPVNPDPNLITNIKLEDDINDSESSDSSSVVESTSEDCLEPGLKKKKAFPWSAETLTFLDRNMVSNNTAATILTASVVELGLDSSEISSSLSTIRRHREMARLQTDSFNRIEFVEKDALVLHIDTKQMSKGPSEKPEERLAITVTGNGNEQLLGVPVIPSGSGRDMAEGVFAELEKRGIAHRIKGIGYDTTASNSGVHNGAVVLLEKQLGRTLLHFPCRHHILELLLEAVFTSALKERSSGPEVSIFKRFQKSWTTIDPSSYDPIELISTDEKATIESTAKRLLATSFSRADYEEMLLLSLLFIGVNEFGGRKIKIKAPGAMHRARWMARATYSLKIYIFRSQFTLRPREKEALRRVCLFILKVYLNAWYSAPLAVAAPRNDFQLMKSLKAYDSVDKEIATAAKSKIIRHLDYLSEINVCLAFFDDNVSVDIKRRMVQNLMRRKTTNDYRKVDQDDLSDYVFKESLLFFEIMEISTEFLLGQDPSEWENDECYQQAKSLCSNLVVVNDSAERAVALSQKYNDFATKKENQKQAMLANVFSNRKKFKKLTKNSIVDQLSSNK